MSDGPAARRGRLRRSGVALLVLGALVIGVLIGGFGPRVLRHPPAPSSSARSSAPGPQATAPPLNEAASTSDAFDSWSGSSIDAAVRFLASDTHHDGAYGLIVTRAATDAQGPTDAITQTVPVTTDAPLDLGLWASATDAQAGAVLLRLQAVGATAPLAELSLPAGSYAWTRFDLAATVPRGVHAVTVSIVSAAPTVGTRLDDLSLRGTGSVGVVLRNGGFERNSATLSLTDASLLLPTGSARLHLASRRVSDGSCAWTVSDGSGGTMHGAVALRRGRATIDLHALPPGYWRLTVSTRVGGVPVRQSTSFAVLDPLPAAPFDFFGVGVHFGGEPDAQLDQELGQLKAIGARYVRTDASWSSSEVSRGVYAWPDDLVRQVGAIQRAGLRPLLIPDYANPLYDGGRTPSSVVGIAAYARFAAALAARFPGTDIDVYNEFDFRFNTGSCGRTPTCYLALLRPTTAAIKAASPQAAVVAPSITGIGVNEPWMDGFITGGGLASTDAIGLHPYVQPAAPESLARQLADLRSAIGSATGGASKPVWFTEYGYSTVPGWVTRQQQARYLERTIGVATSGGVTRLYWYDAFDDGTDARDLEDNFGLFARPSSFAPAAFVPKDAAVVMAVSARALAGRAFVRTLDTGVATAHAVQFGQGADAVLLAWSSGRTRTLAWSEGSARVVGATGRVIDRAARSVRLTGDPVLVTGAGGDVRAR